MAGRLIELLRDRARAAAFGLAGRQYVVEHASIERMVAGYEEMLEGIYRQKAAVRGKEGPFGFNVQEQGRTRFGVPVRRSASAGPP